MNVANKDLCAELYELSGWESDRFYWIEGDDDEPEVVTHKSDANWIENIPAYDLGYLLRKLPTLNKANQYLLMEASPIGYAFGYAEYGELRGSTGTADTPEDALCKLAIELFKQGVLKKESV